MKKIFTLISAAALLVACSDLYGPTESATPEVKSDGIDIEVKLVEDNAVTFTLTPKSEATYYSYLVDQSDVVEALDSASLFSVSYKSVAQGTIDWHLSKSKTLTVEGLAPNTPYVIYAVAGSSTGIPSSVASVTFQTSDKVAPRPARFSADSCVIKLVFSENIKKADGEITAKYYALNDPEFINGTPVGTVTGTVTEIKDATATIEFKLPAGAWYSVDVAEGAFEDYAGNKSVALASSAKLNSSTYEVEGTNIYAQNKLKEFSLGKSDVTTMTDWNTPLMVDFGSEYGYGYTYSKKTGSATYYETGKTVTYDLTPNSDFGYVKSKGKVVVYLPAEPKRGSKVAVKIAAGTFEDYYGNTNAEWTAEFKYAYDYKLEDVLGSYKSSYLTCFSNGDDIAEATDVIVKSNNEKKGNIMFTQLFGYKLAEPVYATFDTALGTISVASPQAMFVATIGGTDYTMAFANGAVSGGSLVISADPAVFNVPEAGKIENTGYFGMYAFDKDGESVGWYDAYYSYDAEKSSEATASVKASNAKAITRLVGDAKVVK